MLNPLYTVGHCVLKVCIHVKFNPLSISESSSIKPHKSRYLQSIHLPFGLQFKMEWTRHNGAKKPTNRDGRRVTRGKTKPNKRQQREVLTRRGEKQEEEKEKRATLRWAEVFCRAVRNLWCKESKSWARAPLYRVDLTTYGNTKHADCCNNVVFAEIIPAGN